jgi:hypothetical protein
MQFGTANDAGTDTTSLTSANAASTLQLGNSGHGSHLRLVDRALAPNDSYFTSTVAGDLTSSSGSLLFTHEAAPAAGQQAFWAEVYTDLTASQIVPLARPVRVFDTRNPAARARISPLSALDAAGRLKANAVLTVDLGDFVIAPAAVYGNLAAVAPVGSGFLTAWPSGARPGTSTLNYTRGVAIANAMVSAVDTTPTAELLRIFTSTTTHVILDVAAFAVGTPGQVLVPTALQASAASAAKAAKLARHGVLRRSSAPR